MRHPVVALVYYVGLLAAVFVCGHPVFLLTMTAGAVALAVFFAGASQTVRRMKYYGIIAVGIGLLNFLFVHRGATILGYWFGNPLTMEAGLYGLYNGLRMVTLMIIFISFNRVIDQAAFLYITAGAMPHIAFIINMALQAMARYQRRAGDLIQVQRTKGITLTGKGYKTKLRTALWLLKAFTEANLEEGMETAEVLKAKDYGVGKRTAYKQYRFTGLDGVWLVAQTGAWIFVFVGTIRGVSAYAFYPRIQPIALTAESGLVFAVFAAAVFAPLVYECFFTLKLRRAYRLVTRGETI